MDAVTALSGSGPAYIAVMIEALVSAGLKVGNATGHCVQTGDQDSHR